MHPQPKSTGGKQSAGSQKEKEMLTMACLEEMEG